MLIIGLIYLQLGILMVILHKVKLLWLQHLVIYLDMIHLYMMLILLYLNYMVQQMQQVYLKVVHLKYTEEQV
ncbi:MAG: hypothetical protein EB059_09905 [Alphaproteobacteria bacterium]|nr:hypothetical protein [Alphaproteobacteria bacterium]